MLGFTTENQLFTVWLQAGQAIDDRYIAALYTRSKSMLRVRKSGLRQLRVFYVTSSGGTSGYYYSDPDGMLDIPLQHDANAVQYGNMSLSVVMYDPNDLDTPLDQFNAKLQVLKGVAYYDMQAPKDKGVDVWSGLYSHQVIIPPNVIIAPTTFDGLSVGVVTEGNFHDPTAINGRVYQQLVGGAWVNCTHDGERDSQIHIDVDADSFRLYDPTPTFGEHAQHVWPLVKPDECAALVCCRWTSLTGAMRQHFFPVVAYIEGNDQSVSLVSAGDGYDVRKAPWKGLRCKLTGLTAYSYWYYMDIANASDLHAILVYPSGDDEGNMTSPESAAYVEAGELETPTGTGFFNFEFTIKMRHYDTV